MKTMEERGNEFFTEMCAGFDNVSDDALQTRTARLLWAFKNPTTDIDKDKIRYYAAGIHYTLNYIHNYMEEMVEEYRTSRSSSGE